MTGRKPVDRARLDEIFGEVLPETGKDERSAPDEDKSADDDWLRAQVPPHHG